MKQKDFNVFLFQKKGKLSRDVREHRKSGRLFVDYHKWLVILLRIVKLISEFDKRKGLKFILKDLKVVHDHFSQKRYNDKI